MLSIALFPHQERAFSGGIRQLLDQRGSGYWPKALRIWARCTSAGVVGVHGNARCHDAEDKGRIGWIEKDVAVAKPGPSAQQDQGDSKQTNDAGALC